MYSSAGWMKTGTSICVTERCRGRGVIKVPMGQDHPCRAQSMLGNQRFEPVQSVLTWVDDHAGATCLGGQHVAIRLERPGRKSCNQHRLTLTGRAGTQICAQRVHT